MNIQKKLLAHSMRAARAAFALWLATAGMAFSSSVCAAQAPLPDSPAIEAQAHAMVAKLTLEQKIELIGGVDDMFTHAEPAIDLPRFKMSDASVGVRTWGPTTAYAGGVALAATWDRDFARKLGESLGKDARARGVNFLLGPGVNIARSPVSGRNFEYLSEDPFLNATLVVPYIEGVQSQGVIATVKHYALNDQEYNRHNVDVDSRRAHHARDLSARFRGRRHQGPRGRGNGLLQPDQRVARHAKRFPESQGAQGRVGFPGRSDVGLGCDLRWCGRRQQRPRSRNALAAIHERQGPVARRAKRAGQRIHHRRQGPPHPAPHCATVGSIARNSILPNPPTQSPTAGRA